MFAIIKTGGKQYKVEEGQILNVEALDFEPQEKVEIRDILLVNTGDTLLVGKPVLESARVEATVIEHAKGDKVIVFKKKRKKQYRRFKGHRQCYTALQIDKISV